MTPARDRAFAAGLLGIWVLVAVALRWGAWAPDLSAVAIAAVLWDRGALDLVYAAPPGFFGGAPAAWAPVMADLAVSGRESFAYVYPPLWAAILAPLTRAGVQPLLDGFTVFHAVLLGLSVLLAGRLARPAGWSETRWALWGVAILSLSLPALHAQMHNQPTILTGFLILLAAERRQAGRPATAGAALALATAIKLTPAAFVLLLLVPVSRRGLAGFGLMAAALAGVSLALAGVDPHRAFLSALSGPSSVTLLIAINLSLESALVGLGALAGIWSWPAALPAAVAAPGWVGVVAGGLGLGLVAALVWRWRQRPEGALALLIGLAVLVPLTGPLGWLHYYLIAMLLIPGLGRLLPAPLARGVGGGVALWAFAPLYLVMRGLPGFDIGFVVIGAALWLGVALSLIVAPRRG